MFKRCELCGKQAFTLFKDLPACPQCGAEYPGLTSPAKGSTEVNLQFPQRENASLEDNIKNLRQQNPAISGFDDSVWDFRNTSVHRWETIFRKMVLDNIPCYTAFDKRGCILIQFSKRALPYARMIDQSMKSSRPFGLRLSTFSQGSYPIMRSSLMFPVGPSGPFILEAPLNVKNGDVQDFCQAILGDEHIDLIIKHIDMADSESYGATCAAKGLAAVIKKEVPRAIRELKPTATREDFKASARLMEKVFPTVTDGVRMSEFIPLRVVGEAKNKVLTMGLDNA